MNSTNPILQNIIMQLNIRNSESRKWEGRTAERIVAEINLKENNKNGTTN